MKRHNVRCKCGKEAKGLATGEIYYCRSCGEKIVVEFHNGIYIITPPFDPGIATKSTFRVISTYESQA